jgi:sulfite reductase beta subunit-like hemoprotein
VRFTTIQNIVIPNVPDAKVPALLAEPLLAELPPTRLARCAASSRAPVSTIAISR